MKERRETNELVIVVYIFGHQKPFQFHLFFSYRVSLSFSEMGIKQKIPRKFIQVPLFYIEFLLEKRWMRELEMMDGHRNGAVIHRHVLLAFVAGGPGLRHRRVKLHDPLFLLFLYNLRMKKRFL